ncbi:hypothetical protein [Herminiimonas contaminans]|uniref:Uncharacterized protein n=1 Tax=Herminiimonas contaminans TaxID=1111140 RepID=A0ABS0EY55_9BURK|nr:hypothetical protein [Herminiimonas contaminans]MBF8179772.1 hypothetical protein [Herminiimonas contaminans]
MNAGKQPGHQTKSHNKIVSSKPAGATRGKTAPKTKTPWTMDAQKRIHSKEAITGGGQVRKDSLTAHVTKRVAENKK